MIKENKPPRSAWVSWIVKYSVDLLHNETLKLSSANSCIITGFQRSSFISFYPANVKQEF